MITNNDNNIVPFHFESHPVRIHVNEQGEPWWVAKDVCEVLDIKDHHQAIEKLDDDERGRCRIPTPGGLQETKSINESGLYSLILRSDKPAAKPFRRWVTHVVLPSIRKTGEYKTKSSVQFPSVSRDMKAALSLAKTCGLSGNQAILAANHAIKKVQGVDCLDLIGHTALECEVQERHYTATDLGNVFFAGLSGKAVNEMLEAAGIISSFRDCKNRKCWNATEKGKSHTVLKDTGKRHGDGTPIQQMFYLESVVELLK